MDPRYGPGMNGAKIVITGLTGQVGEPVAKALAADNEVIGLARYSDATVKQRLEDAGVECLPVDLAAGELGRVPTDADYVLNFAVSHGGDKDWDWDLTLNAEATGLLMQYCQDARAFLHCSSTGVYQPAGAHQLKESDPLGDNHRTMLPTYSICKVAAEAVARTAARQFDLPTTIARLNVPYGDNGGWPAFHLEFMLGGAPVPVLPDDPNLYNPIHEDDIIEQVPRLLDVASVPATIVNWGGPEQVSVKEWCEYLGELTGLEPALVETEQTIGSVTIDTTRMHELIGEAKVPWRDGFRRMVEARHPELLARA
jgi:UDP-glucuronate 4-epimerase